MKSRRQPGATGAVEVRLGIADLWIDDATDEICVLYEDETLVRAPLAPPVVTMAGAIRKG